MPLGCYRTSSLGKTNPLTILAYTILLIIAIFRQSVYFSILMTLGIVMHLLMHIYTRPFISRVCLENGKLIAND